MNQINFINLFLLLRNTLRRLCVPKGIEESMKVNEQLLFFLEKSHLVGVVGQMGNEHGFQLMKNWD